jgi:hypothetical protein
MAVSNGNSNGNGSAKSTGIANADGGANGPSGATATDIDGGDGGGDDNDDDDGGGSGGGGDGNEGARRSNSLGRQKKKKKKKEKGKEKKEKRKKDKSGEQRQPKNDFRSLPTHGVHVTVVRADKLRLDKRITQPTVSVVLIDEETGAVRCVRSLAHSRSTAQPFSLLAHTNNCSSATNPHTSAHYLTSATRHITRCHTSVSFFAIKSAFFLYTCNFHRCCDL